MRRQSGCIRAKLGKAEENGDAPPPAPANWQEMFAAIEARMPQADEELGMYMHQVSPRIPEAVSPPVQAPTPVAPGREVWRELFYERFRKQHLPVF